MTVTPTASQVAHAEQLVAEPERWSRGRSKETGQSFWLIQGSAGHAHYATASGCTCKGFFYRGSCSHQLAVKVREDRERGERPAPAPRSRYEDLFPAEVA